MDVIDRARKYTQSCPPAVSGQGGHDATYKVAVALVNGFSLGESDAMLLMGEYNSSCQPPWTEQELLHKVKGAISTPHDKEKGHLLGPGTHRSTSSNTKTSPQKSGTVEKPKKEKNYNVSATGELPEPLKDGARAFLRTAFKEGEGVRIQIARTNEEGREVPKDGGITLSREEWLRKLDDVGGDPNGIMSNSANNGIYCAINPYTPGGTKDADVTCYRHALLEFDGISLQEQWQLYTQSNIPCSAVIASGGKSIHAWVKVDARDRKEYDERVRLIYEHFSAYNPDPKNKNVGRFSRLPNCVRFQKRQELLALNVGAESFTAWQASIDTASLGRRLTTKGMISFVPTADPTNLIGDRWLCEGGTCFLVAQSGVGKSSMRMQLAFNLVLGRAFFGVCPVRPLRVLILQAENDDGDESEMFQGVWRGMGFPGDGPDALAIYQQLDTRLFVVTEDLHSGQAFCDSARREIDRYKPDVVIADPFLSYFGDNVNDQVACTQFLRTWLLPIIKATKVAWIWVHHTGKPSSDPRSKKGWNSSDFSYIGAGSAELVNWARAIMYIHKVDDQTFRLLFAKRGKRAGARDMQGNKTSEVFLRYSTTGIYWEQVEKPVSEEETEEAKKPIKTEQGPIKFDLEAFFESIRGQYFTVTKLFQKLQDYGITNKQFYGDNKKGGLWDLMQKRMFCDEELKPVSWVYGKTPPEDDLWG